MVEHVACENSTEQIDSVKVQHRDYTSFEFYSIDNKLIDRCTFLSNLQTLIFHDNNGSHLIDPLCIDRFFGSLSNLKELSFGSTSILVYDMVDDIIHGICSISTLRRLSLPGLPMSRMMMKDIITGLPDLECLHISYSCKLPFEYLACLSYLDRLRLLSIEVIYCNNTDRNFPIYWLKQELDNSRFKRLEHLEIISPYMTKIGINTDPLEISKEITINYRRPFTIEIHTQKNMFEIFCK